MSLFPTDWKADRLKDLCSVNRNSLSASTAPDFEFPYLEISNVDYFGIVDIAAIERLRFEDAPSRARRLVFQNSTIISSVRPNLPGKPSSGCALKRWMISLKRQ
jgi:type I restriction enzyme, S subunit